MTGGRWLGAALAALSILVAGARDGAAQAYPQRPVRLVVPAPAGGPTDVPARLVAEGLSNLTGQRFVVENRVGAGGIIAAESVARADPDGYTLLYANTSVLAVNPALQPKLPYDAATAFASIGFVSNSPQLLIANPKLPVKNVQELVAYAKANPGKLRYVTPGVASSPHLAGAELWRKAGVDLTDVPYAGEASGFPHLLTGEVDLGIITTSGVASQRLRPLAVFATERVKRYPDVPTVAELGFPILPSGYGGLFVRAGTPAPVIARLEAACREATADQAYQDLAEKQFQQSSYLDRDAFTARLDADYKSKAALIPTLKLPE